MQASCPIKNARRSSSASAIRTVDNDLNSVLSAWEDEDMAMVADGYEVLHPGSPLNSEVER